jgi:6-phosphofructokinase 1
MAGEASLVLSVEDVNGRFEAKEPVLDSATQQPVIDPKTGSPKMRKVMNLQEVIRYIVAAMRARERDGKEFGVIVLAEGLAEFLPSDYLKGVPRDDHGHISIAQVDLGRSFARLVADEYRKSTGKSRKVTGLQLGYESRCAAPHAFDVMLGSQLGVGAYRALVEEGHDGVMISAAGQLDLNYVPFGTLINPETLVTVVRYINTKSDFHRLARFLETEIGE